MISQTKAALAEDRVDVFLINVCSFEMEEGVHFLSDDERERAAKLKADSARHQFIVTRAVLRQLLATHLKIDSHDIYFSCEQRCKPVLDKRHHPQPIEFNVSHSGDHALIALTLTNKTGIDIEWMDNTVDYQALANRFFSESERTALHSVDEVHRRDAFYGIWVRKESFVKAIGEGIAVGLDTFSVSTDDGITAVKLQAPLENRKDWYCREINVPEGYRAALTTNRRDLKVTSVEIGY